MKPTVCVFSKHFGWMKNLEEATGAIKRIGFDGVDLAVRKNGHVDPDNIETELPAAVAVCRQAGLEVPMIVSDISDPDDPRTERVIRASAELGIRSYRLAYWKYPDGRSIDATLSAIKTDMVKLASLNAKYGIRGEYQNHAGNFFGSAVWDLWYVIKDLDPRYMGVQYDVRHAVIEGGGCWSNGFNALKDHIGSADIKDGGWQRKDDGSYAAGSCPLGEGMVDFPRYLTMLKDAGFTGPVSLHYEYDVIPGGTTALSYKEKVEKTITGMTPDLSKFREWAGCYL